MEVDFLAQRLAKPGWLGRSRVKLYPKTVSTVRVIAYSRIFVGGVFLAQFLPNDTGVAEGARSRLYVLGALSLLFAVVDWIPYRVYTWQRRPTIFTKWATPASGTASILVNTAFVLAASVTDVKFIALFALVLAIAAVVVMNIGLHYYGPMNLPPVYEPVCKEGRHDQGNDDAAREDTSRGPLARLYQSQLSSNRGAEDHRGNSQQSVSELMSVSSNLERKRAMRAKYC
jgi:hypothetical protein